MTMKQGGHANVALFVPHNGCPHQCSFCNQNRITGQSRQPTAQDVHEAARRARETLPEGAQAELAFFGGSFTAVDPCYMRSLLEAAAPYVRQGLFSGIRISTRPDAVSQDVLRLLKEYGVSAVELGAQSMRDSVLAANGRGHTAEDVRQASRRIHAMGMELGLQMMTGLWQDDAQGARDTAEELIGLHPETVRIYPTVVMEQTELARLYREGLYTPMDLEETVELCAGLLDRFAREGISVIRLGLHDTPQLHSGYLAGAYHPALRELCESRRFFHAVCGFLERETIPFGPVSFAIHPKAYSRGVGQKRQNLEKFRQAGWEVSLLQDPTLSVHQVHFCPQGNPGTKEARQKEKDFFIPGWESKQKGEHPCG